ncbi:uncharacterized protein [Ambystoma mexicanum]|uniref:uncharacterized protein n=1 Tax=Ambystoma mexicanum TaxID=8296 RepID=UPI0037E751C2
MVGLQGQYPQRGFFLATMARDNSGDGRLTHWVGSPHQLSDNQRSLVSIGVQTTHQPFGAEGNQTSAEGISALCTGKECPDNDGQHIGHVLPQQKRRRRITTTVQRGNAALVLGNTRRNLSVGSSPTRRVEHGGRRSEQAEHSLPRVESSSGSPSKDLHPLGNPSILSVRDLSQLEVRSVLLKGIFPKRSTGRHVRGGLGISTSVRVSPYPSDSSRNQEVEKVQENHDPNCLELVQENVVPGPSGHVHLPSKTSSTKRGSPLARGRSVSLPAPLIPDRHTTALRASAVPPASVRPGGQNGTRPTAEFHGSTGTIINSASASVVAIPMESYGTPWKWGLTELPAPDFLAAGVGIPQCYWEVRRQYNSQVRWQPAGFTSTVTAGLVMRPITWKYSKVIAKVMQKESRCGYAGKVCQQLITLLAKLVQVILC